MVAAVGFSRENPTHGDELALGKERPGQVTVNVLDTEDKNKTDIYRVPASKRGGQGIDNTPAVLLRGVTNCRCTGRYQEGYTATIRVDNSISVTF